VSDVDTGVVDSLKVLDPDGRLEKRPNIGSAAKRGVVPAPDMPLHWVTTGSCHVRTTALPFLICGREWRDVPVNQSRPRRVASFQSRLLPLGNEPGQMWSVSTWNLLDSLLWSGLPAKKIS
jgi:hypothetical protein